MTETPDTPWRRATSKQKSMRSEREGAKLADGHVVPMSGAGHQKGDIRTAEWLGEDKFTEAASFTVTAKVLDKTVSEALASRRLPFWRITMLGYKLRLYREEDALYLHAMADKSREHE